MSKINNTKPSNQVAIQVWVRDEGRCWYCKKPLIPAKDVITFDHVKPVSKGGHKKHLDNLRICCQECNLEKADRDLFIPVPVKDAPKEPAHIGAWTF